MTEIPASDTGAPLRVSVKSLAPGERSTPVTLSVNVIGNTPTVAFVGSGVTAEMTADGTTVSAIQVSLAFAISGLPARS